MRFIQLSLIVGLILVFSSCQRNVKILEANLPKFRELDTFLLGQNCDRKDIKQFAIELQKSYDELRKEKLRTEQEYESMLTSMCESNSKVFRDIKFIEQKIQKQKDDNVYKIISHYSVVFGGNRKLLATLDYDVKISKGKIYLVKHNLSLTDIQGKQQ